MLRYLALLLALLLPLAAQVDQLTNLPGVPDPIAPVPGILIVDAGAESAAEIKPRTRDLLHGPEDNPSVGVVLLNQKEVFDAEFWNRNSHEFTALTPRSEGKYGPAQLAEIAQAEHVWVSPQLPASSLTPALTKALRSVLERGGRVAGGFHLGTCQGRGGQIVTGLDLFPRSCFSDPHKVGDSPDTVDGLVTWIVPPESTVVIHEGRRVAVLGDQDVEAFVPARGEWPARREILRPPAPELPYTADLFSWTRSAQSRERPVFPAKEQIVPEVKKGTLMIVGGGGSTEDMWTRFIEEAGGKEAHFVCIVQSHPGYSAQKLAKLGCQNITVLGSNLSLRPQAEKDSELLKALERADAIYFGGGRTYRFMDVYQQSRAHELMFNLLERGGIIAGTSAGAQIQGDFLVRGDPRSNRTIWQRGNDTGLSFLRGVIIDAHFRERGRHKTLPALLKQHPTMLGIGIDEATAIVVQHSRAEVLGRGSVTFYDTARDLENREPVILRKGQSYDLKARRQSN